MCVFLGLAIVFGSVWAPPAFAKNYKWRLSQVMPEDSDFHKRALAFAAEVKEKTNGRIDITIYSGGTLCDWVECHERVMRGDYELAMQPLAPTYDPPTCSQTPKRPRQLTREAAGSIIWWVIYCWIRE
jgi:TRAP-type C4-dicarboxylate transport system substrate-binding protein